MMSAPPVPLRILERQGRYVTIQSFLRISRIFSSFLASRIHNNEFSPSPLCLYA